MRKVIFANDEYYHIYNRGVEKRDIFMDDDDFARFALSMKEFNSIETIGSIYENSFRKSESQLGSPASKLQQQDKSQLVEFVAYCLNPNHYHFLVRQISDKGIEKFMQRLGTGYTKYFNNKYERTGVLFQGRFKAKHVDTNAYLLHVGSYIDLNFKVHHITKGKYRSSWDDVVLNQYLVIKRNVLLSQLRKNTDYQDFATKTVNSIIKNRVITPQKDQALLIE